jgi:hypothetical protein
MQAAIKRCSPVALVLLASAWVATRAGTAGDWSSDSYPAVHALASGHLGAYLEATPMMGSLATLAQAPFVAFSGASGLAAYHWASFPCVLAAGLAGLYLGRIAARRGAGSATALLIALLCVVNPLTFQALEKGHPEEVLTAALAIAALAAAGERRPRRAALLLGLALASKQWAVIAVLPVLLVLPRRRLRAAALAAAVAAALLLPGLLAAPGSFLGVQREAAGAGRVVGPWSAWYPLASSRTAVYEIGGERLEAEVQDAPPLAGGLSHPLIVMLAVALPLAVARRRGLPLSAADGFALLALLALLRCVLDPVDNLYYHAPLLLALIGWDAFASRGLPLRALLGVAAALALWQQSHGLTDPASFNALYLVAMAGLGAWLVSSFFRPIPWTGVQNSDLSRPVTQISGIK